jgi:hypothetical protein
LWIMRVLGIRTAKDRFEWAVVEGVDRMTGASIESDRASIPPFPNRGAELVWVREQVHALLDRHQPDLAAISVAEPAAGQLARAEVDGVITEALGSRQVATSRLYAATVRGRFKAKTREALDEALESVPLIANTPKSRRGPMIAAVAELPK